ncbi:MAG TPA: hypothetical protein VLO11_01200 [Luteolibacter sp.]|nr:hypothetical protein [Luteolibacter sp.]
MFKWLVISVGVVCALFVVLIFYAICGPRPKPVSGTDRPDWLPATATDVFHKSQGGFGWWRAAEFTISEVDFRAYADSRGWHLTEAQNVIPPGLYHLGRPSVIRNKDGEEQLVLIPKALLYQKLASNNGGIRAAYDLEAQRAYYSESHR